MHNTRTSPKWNAAIINAFEYTCVFPSMTCQHVCREKGLLVIQLDTNWADLSVHADRSLDMKRPQQGESLFGNTCDQHFLLRITFTMQLQCFVLEKTHFGDNATSPYQQMSPNINIEHVQKVHWQHI